MVPENIIEKPKSVIKMPKSSSALLLSKKVFDVLFNILYQFITTSKWCGKKSLKNYIKDGCLIFSRI